MEKPPTKPVEKPYVQPKMVSWFHPKILLNAAIKAVVASTFGNYADRRETEAALHNSEKEKSESDQLNSEYSAEDKGGIWIDFISDTGDGFSSTYSVALAAAQEKLTFDWEGRVYETLRGKILCLGGDQIYPTPTMEMYEAKFRVPFRAAFPRDMSDIKNERRPHLYAIPGNHDWYDGLANFLKIFCQGRWIGNWMTQQHRSYFALQLPYRYWIWATDIQLDSDIDQPQLDYFLDIAKTKMRNGDKVILITAEPAWVYKELYKNNKSYERLKYFTEVYITNDKDGKVEKKFELAVTLTGDLHHYSHYCTGNDEEQWSNHFITAGGGGAFLHLTHNLPQELTKLNEVDDLNNLGGRKVTMWREPFPSKKESRSIVTGNLLFPRKNLLFTFFVGCLSLMLAWMSQSFSQLFSGQSFFENLVAANNIGEFFTAVKDAIVYAPPVLILTCILVFGFYKLTDVKSGKRIIPWIGLFHGLLQVTSMFALFWLYAKFNSCFLHLKSNSCGQILLFIVECILVSGFVTGFIVGGYLYFCNRFLNIHLDEASSSLACEDFKNFLRIHVAEDGITIYPIKIPRVIKKWKQDLKENAVSHEDELFFTPDPDTQKYPDCKLINKPIFIKNKKR